MPSPKEVWMIPGPPGMEDKETRPALILSDHGKKAGEFLYAPMSTSGEMSDRRPPIPLAAYIIQTGDCELAELSMVVLDHMRIIDHNTLIKNCGTIDDVTFLAIAKCAGLADEFDFDY